MQDIDQAKSGAKITGAILLIASMIIIGVGYNRVSVLLIWIFAPILVVSFVLFFVFIYRIIKFKK